MVVVITVMRLHRIHLVVPLTCLRRRLMDLTLITLIIRTVRHHHHIRTTMIRGVTDHHRHILTHILHRHMQLAIHWHHHIMATACTRHILPLLLVHSRRLLPVTAVMAAARRPLPLLLQ